MKKTINRWFTEQPAPPRNEFQTLMALWLWRAQERHRVKRNRRVLGALILAGLIASASTCTGCAYKPRYTGPRQKAGTIAVAAGTGSMAPVIKKGDQFVLIPKPIEDVLTGQDGEFVGRYDAGRELNIIHRALVKGRAANGEWYIIAKGDANSDRDYVRIHTGNYLGVYVPLTP